MLGSHFVSIPTEWTLATVLSVLTLSVLASMLKPQSARPN
jgi:hypothetical protein